MPNLDSLLKDENTESENTPKPQQAIRLVRWLGLIFLATSIFTLFPTINYISLFLLISVGIGMFERHAWSRIVAIIVAICYFLGLSAMLFIYIFRSDYVNFIRSTLSRELTIVLVILEIVFYGLIVFTHTFQKRRELW